MLERKIMDAIRKKAKVKEVLERAIELEKSMDADALGFEWYEVQAPATLLNKLVTEGILEIRLKTRSSTHYRLANSEETKKALQLYSLLEEVPGIEVEAEVPPDLFNVIVGHENVKDLFWKSINASSPIHILLQGPTASAKTMFLDELRRLPNAAYILAGTATRVGIRDLLLEEQPTYLLIDELERCRNPGDLSVLNSWMESGIVSVTKHGVRREIHSVGWVYAACITPKKLPADLLDRFEVVSIEPYTDEELREVVVNVLTIREEKDRELAEYIADMVLLHELRSPRAAVRIARASKTREEVDEYLALVRRKVFGDL